MEEERYTINKNGELEPVFIRDENGNLQKLTKDGRIRKNWKVTYREKSKKFLKDHCEQCGRHKNFLKQEGIKLTIHHKIPLRVKVVVNEENCVTLCEECHRLADHSTPPHLKIILCPICKKKQISPLELGNFYCSDCEKILNKYGGTKK